MRALFLILISLQVMASPEEIIERAEGRVLELARAGTVYEEAQLIWGADPERLLMRKGGELKVLDLRSGGLLPLYRDGQLRGLFAGRLPELFLPRCLPGGLQVMTESGGLWIPSDGGPARRLDPREQEAFEIQAAAIQERANRSQGGGGEAMIHVHNRSRGDWQIAWLGFDGTPREYGRIAPGRWFHCGSFRGHAWKLTGPRGEVVWNSRLDGDCLVTGKPELRKREASRQDLWQDISWRDGNPHDRGRPISTDASAKVGYWVVDFSDRGRYLGVIRTDRVPKYQLSVIDTRAEKADGSNSRTVDYNRAGEAIDRQSPFIIERDSGRRLEVPAERLQDLWSARILGITEELGKAWIYLHYRGHQRSSVISLDLKSGAVQDLIDERAATFIDYSQKFLAEILPGGKEMLWMSERDGWNHLYLYDLATAACRQVTRGAFVVKKLERHDAASDWLYLKVCGVDPRFDPYFEQLVRCRRDGSSFSILTPEEGDHEWSFSPDGRFIVDTWSRIDQPRRQVLRHCDGRLIRELSCENDDARRKLGWRPPLPLSFPGRDGKTPIHGLVYLPEPRPDGTKAPILEEIYAGPPGTNCPKRYGFNHRREQLRAMGFAVVIIDGMGTNWRSKAFHDHCWRNLKDAGFPDRIRWIREMARRFPVADAGRVGIFGGSAGGQNAAGALIFHPEFYAAAFADCGCHDNRMDKIWWNEAWMGWPVGPWYSESSNIDQAARLQGRLFLVGGECDTNVDPLSTLKFAEALRQAGKNFEFAMVPGGGHCVGNLPEIRKRWLAFFIEALALGGGAEDLARFRASRAALAVPPSP
ncbi:MAG: hypothetical protein RL095_794 [Verrucomicrobiota bacterium]|jgi:dienelactone hydrolase